MSAETKHTPEPWEVVSLCVGVAIRPVGTVSIFDRVIDCAKLNFYDARRIVQCVNACAGMTDPAAEIAALRECAESLRVVLKIKFFAEVEHARGRLGVPQSGVKAMDKAIAALTKLDESRKQTNGETK